jgi:uncharacterized protein (DUF433 family)
LLGNTLEQHDAGVYCNQAEDLLFADDENLFPRVTPSSNNGKKLTGKEVKNMAALDWSQCPAVESVPGRLSGAWVFRDTRMPVSAVFENLEAGATVDEISEWFSISKGQLVEVLEFAARSLAAPVPAEPTPVSVPNARSF